MIVDDEAIVRKGLMCFTDWSALDCEVVCEAGDGIEAIEQLAVHDIDIIVTDIKMAGMDGIELTKFVHENFPYIKVILLTAFADFTYAQSAIKYQAVDFVVKTNPSAQIPDAINKAKQLLLKEKDHERKLLQLENAINDNRSEIREKFLKDAVCGIIADEAMLLNRTTELGIKLDYYFVINVEIRDSSESNDNETNASDHLYRFTDSIKQFLSLAFEKGPHYTVEIKKNALLAIVSFPASNTSECTQTLLMTCNEIIRMADHFKRFSINIGISGMHRDILLLSLAYVESCQAIQDSFYNENHVSVYIPHSGQAPELESRPYNVAQQINECLQEGHYEAAIQRLNQLMEKYRSIKEPIENIKVTCLIIGSYCFRLLEARQPITSDLTGDEPSLYKQILGSKSIQNLLHILERLIADISNALSMSDRQHNYIVIETQKYIRENFNKNLTLQIIADHIHVNSSYLSRLYKRETGESLVDTINKYRIEIAKRLLKDPSKKVFEVSTAVGIDSPAYFTHVFTKYTGSSPKTFKLNFFQNGQI
jgi:Response regulator containing CheY-like receiver domain and AraC-type DNA-binding domain